MKPRGHLNIEHRLIEKMILLAENEINVINKTNVVSTIFIDAFADFLHFFIDLTHNGKEEEILFKELKSKKIDDSVGKLMQELFVEHINARKVTEELIKANKDYIFGSYKSLDIIIDKLSFLTNFYPAHISKEEKEFMPDAEKYFTHDELAGMMNSFLKFDCRMIHEKYSRLFESLSKNRYSYSSI